MKSFLTQPLLHFFVLSAALLIVYDYLDEGDTDPVAFAIADLERLDTLWQERMGRAPSLDELRTIVNGHLREEVLYREATALGLDRDDIIIRRRLAQKMAFMTQGMVEAREPDVDVLKAWFAAHSEHYLIPARLTLSHVYFSRDLRGANSRADALAARKTITATPLTPQPASRLGDPFMLSFDYKQVAEREIASRFGSPFATDLFALTELGWQGPIGSGYGEHLVHVTDRVPQRLPEVEEIRERLVADWRAEQKRVLEAELIAELMNKYKVTVAPEVRARIGEQIGMLQ